MIIRQKKKRLQREEIISQWLDLYPLQKMDYSQGNVMRADLWMPFGLLICADETRPFYERSRWQFASDFLYYNQQSQRRLLKTCVMILQLTDRVWPEGEIDLCGLPW